MVTAGGGEVPAGRHYDLLRISNRKWQPQRWHRGNSAQKSERFLHLSAADNRAWWPDCLHRCGCHFLSEFLKSSPNAAPQESLRPPLPTIVEGGRVAGMEGAPLALKGLGWWEGENEGKIVQMGGKKISLLGVEGLI